MTEPVDLGTFRPENPQEMVEGILSHVVPLLGPFWQQARNEIEANVTALAQNSFSTARRLAAGEISAPKADALLHTQELAFNNMLAYSEFLAYDLAQEVLDAVFGVVKAAIKNWTGIELNF